MIEMMLRLMLLIPSAAQQPPTGYSTHHLAQDCQGVWLHSGLCLALVLGYPTLQHAPPVLMLLQLAQLQVLAMGPLLRQTLQQDCLGLHTVGGVAAQMLHKVGIAPQLCRRCLRRMMLGHCCDAAQSAHAA
jgi:hypothetical protein